MDDLLVQIMNFSAHIGSHANMKQTSRIFGPFSQIGQG
jgi:hypothetical protein